MVDYGLVWLLLSVCIIALVCLYVCFCLFVWLLVSACMTSCDRVVKAPGTPHPGMTHSNLATETGGL